MSIWCERMDHIVDPNECHPLNNFVTLPTELIVYIISFLTNLRDIVKLSYVCRRLRDVCGCQTPLLWREFIWPHFDICQERCVKRVMRSCGRHIKRLSFPDHVPNPSKLTSMLRYCINLVELSIPTSKLRSSDQLGKIIQSVGTLQNLDITWSSDLHPPLDICGKLKELTIRIGIKAMKKGKNSVSPRRTLCKSLNSWLDEWAIKRFQPQTLKIVVGRFIPFKNLVERWPHLNSYSSTGHAGCLEVFSDFKVPMDLFPTPPDFQLRFGQSHTLPFVKPSRCGLLGLDERDILLIHSTNGSNEIYKALILSPNFERGHFNSESGVIDVSFVTHFDASFCSLLYSGHLEQLAIACPNLQRLNLQCVDHCLEHLQGLHLIATCCRNLQGLNLLDISVVESYVQLWKIIVDMKLTYLAISLCVLIPWEEDEPAELEIIRSFQECINLKALETKHYNPRQHYDLSVLSNFPSLVHCLVSQYPYGIEVLINSCPKLRYLKYFANFPHFSNSVIKNSNLQQLRIIANHASIPYTFMQRVSAHGGLVHVLLRASHFSDDGITALIGNSPNLITFHITVEWGNITSDTGVVFSKKDYEMALNRKFCDRKLFTCGDFQLSPSDDNLLIKSDMNIISFWPSVLLWHFDS